MQSTSKLDLCFEIWKISLHSKLLEARSPPFKVRVKGILVRRPVNADNAALYERSDEVNNNFIVSVWGNVGLILAAYGDTCLEKQLYICVCFLTVFDHIENCGISSIAHVNICRAYQ